MSICNLPNWKGRPTPSLVKLNLPDLDDAEIEREAKQAAERVRQQRIVRQGSEAWQTIGKADSFEAWKRIGAALAVGKKHALTITGANAPMGSRYRRAFSDWIDQHGFKGMQKSVRSVAIELVEHLPAIEQFRKTLSDKERARLVHPLSNVRRWRQSRTPKTEPDALARAESALRHFLKCVEALPADQAGSLRQQARAAL